MSCCRALLALIFLGLAAQTSNAQPISGELDFVAIGSYIESGGIVSGYDFSPEGTTSNNPGLVMRTSGAIRDILGVRGWPDGAMTFVQVFDFDLNTLPALEWIVPVDNGNGVTGLLSFVITGGSEVAVGSNYWVDLAGTGVLSFECLAPGEASGGTPCANNPGLTPSIDAAWTLSNSLKSFTIIGRTVSAPAPLALLGCAFVAFSITRRRITSRRVRKT